MKVQLLQDGIFQVIQIYDNEVLFQGNLSDCEAFIKLKENGYI